MVVELFCILFAVWTALQRGIKDRVLQNVTNLRRISGSGHTGGSERHTNMCNIDFDTTSRLETYLARTHISHIEALVWILHWTTIIGKKKLSLSKLFARQNVSCAGRDGDETEFVGSCQKQVMSVLMRVWLEFGEFERGPGVANSPALCLTFDLFASVWGHSIDNMLVGGKWKSFKQKSNKTKRKPRGNVLKCRGCSIQ